MGDWVNVVATARNSEVKMIQLPLGHDEIKISQQSLGQPSRNGLEANGDWGWDLRRGGTAGHGDLGVTWGEVVIEANAQDR